MLIQLWTVTYDLVLRLPIDYSNALQCSAMCSMPCHPFYLVFILFLLILDLALQHWTCYAFHTILHILTTYFWLSMMFLYLYLTQLLSRVLFLLIFLPFFLLIISCFPLFAKYFAHWLPCTISHIGSPPHFFLLFRSFIFTLLSIYTFHLLAIKKNAITYIH
jgi:hypothetical protein